MEHWRGGKISQGIGQGNGVGPLSSRVYELKAPHCAFSTALSHTVLLRPLQPLPAVTKAKS